MIHNNNSQYTMLTTFSTLSCRYQSYVNEIDFSILLCLTPDDFTCQWESRRMGKSYLVVKTVSLVDRTVCINHACLTPDGFTCHSLDENKLKCIRQTSQHSAPKLQHHYHPRYSSSRPQSEVYYNVTRHEGELTLQSTDPRYNQ